MSTMLSPPNSSWSPPSPIRKGGILLKPSSAAANALPYDPTQGGGVAQAHGSPTGSNRSLSDSSSEDPAKPVTPTLLRLPVGTPLQATMSAGGPIGSQVGRPKIKFAPLPDPRAAGGERRLSTGADMHWAAILGPGGERTTELQRADRRGAFDGETGQESALGDEDDLDDDYLDRNDDKGGRRGSMLSLSGSWRGTKKLLKPLGLSSSSSSGSKQFTRTTSIESNGSNGSNDGGALSRTFSNLSRSLTPATSNTTPASPGGRRTSTASSSEGTAERQARLLSSLAPTTSRELSISGSRDRSASPGHRASNSLDVAQMSTSPRSPIGMRMINGRVYGSKGMDTIKKAEADALRGPEFKEWGSEGLGSNSRAGVEEEDDGSGMGWVKKRREAKEKKEREEKEAAEAAAAAGAPPTPPLEDPSEPLLFASDTPPGAATPVGNAPIPPQIVTTSPPPTRSGPPSRSNSEMYHPSGLATPRAENTHRLESITIPGHQHPPRSGATTPTADKMSAFSLTPMMPSGGGSAARPIAISGRATSPGAWSEDDGKGSSLEDSDSEEEDDDEDRDDEESEDDSEEERLQEEARRTAQCAGVEVLSRHKSIEQ